MPIRKLCLGVLFLTLLTAGAGMHLPTFKQPQRDPNPPSPAVPTPAQTDSGTQWLHYDYGVPLYYFYLPDPYDDHYFNVRFTAPDSCRLLRAALLFRDSVGTGVSRDLHIVIFKGTPGGLLPPYLSPDSSALDSVIIPGDSVLVDPETTFVDLSGLDTVAAYFSANTRFHVAWEPDYTDTVHSGIRAIWSDNGDPPTNYSCEWWGGTVNRWGTMFDDWLGHGVNFMLRVEIEVFQDTASVRRWLDPDQPLVFQLHSSFSQSVQCTNCNQL